MVVFLSLILITMAEAFGYNIIFERKQT